MLEKIPGNSTEAGPDTRVSEPEPDWDDLMCYAREELQFAQTRHRAKTAADRRQLVLAIMRAESFLESAKDELKKMELGPCKVKAGRRSSTIWRIMRGAMSANASKMRLGAFCGR